MRETVLLTEPGGCGTLAAARELGRRGIRVWTTSSDAGTPTAHSRYVERHVRTAGAREPEAQLANLLAIGARAPGMVLYPTSDDQAFLVASGRERLAEVFQLYSPSVDALRSVLDKRRLFEACAKVGLEAPESWFAECEADVAAAAERATFPVLLKQRTQVFSATRTKGRIVHERAALPEAYARFVDANPHHGAIRAEIPRASWPLIQRFHEGVHLGTYLVSGFVDRDHRFIVAQAANKLLQYPRTLGIALCLEPVALEPELEAKLLELCRITGYFGVFQLEFLVVEGRRLLIDFNPRYYHYLAFDVARGLALPWFVQLGATGRDERLHDALRQASTRRARESVFFSHRLRLRELLWTQRLAGTMTPRDFHHWRSWYAERRDRMVDAVADRDDVRPELAFAAATALDRLRHPRSFVRNVVLDR